MRKNFAGRNLTTGGPHTTISAEQRRSALSGRVEKFAESILSLRGDEYEKARNREVTEFVVGIARLRSLVGRLWQHRPARIGLFAHPAWNHFWRGSFHGGA